MLWTRALRQCSPSAAPALLQKHSRSPQDSIFASSRIRNRGCALRGMDRARAPKNESAHRILR
eukprot:8176320-Alexandrium_andersonii.AAC.1